MIIFRRAGINYAGDAKVISTQVKLSPGFGAKPEACVIKGKIETLVNFVLPLRQSDLD